MREIWRGQSQKLTGISMDFVAADLLNRVAVGALVPFTLQTATRVPAVVHVVVSLKNVASTVEIRRRPAVLVGRGKNFICPLQ
jgi:hypothetical protein